MSLQPGRDTKSKSNSLVGISLESSNFKRKDNFIISLEEFLDFDNSNATTKYKIQRQNFESLSETERENNFQ
jgi:hypothetical protein